MNETLIQKRGRGRPFGSFKGAHPARVNGKATKAYTAYQAMVARCTRPKTHNYAWYGGRGITVCRQWLGRGGYSQFIKDVGVPPEGMWLDRINNDGNYEPGNVRWVTPLESARNRRQGGLKNRNPESLMSMARAAGISYSIVYQRVKLHGWPLEKALSTPNLGRGKPVGGWVR